MDHLQLPKISEVAQIIWHTQDFYFYFYKRWLFPLRGCQKKKSTTSTTSVFLNLPFLANFYKLTGMSRTTTTTTTMVFDKLTNLQLIFCYSLKLFFCQYCRLIFSDIFWKNIFTWYFCNLFFCYSLQLILGQSFRIIFFGKSCKLIFLIFFATIFSPDIFANFSTPCKAQLNLQNLEANLQILLILFRLGLTFGSGFGAYWERGLGTWTRAWQ